MSSSSLSLSRASSIISTRSALPQYSDLNHSLPEDEELTTENPPPRYSNIFVHRSRRLPGGGVPHSQHDAHIRKSSGNPWATLHVYGRASKTPQKTLRVFGGDTIMGNIELNLGSAQVVHSITLSLKGKIFTGSQEDGQYTFLDHPLVIWTKTSGDPRIPGTTSWDLDKKFDGKLVGDYSWPFSIPFPTHIKTFPSTPKPGKRTSNVPEALAVPQTFLERGINANVEYLFALDIVHGRLRMQSGTVMKMVYIPEIISGQPTSLRHLSYREHSPLPSPPDDPNGWLTRPPSDIRGKILRKTTVEVSYQFSLAKPLSYARGTVIPCYLAFSGVDVQALDLLGCPMLPDVRLVRRIKYSKDPSTAFDELPRKNSFITESDDVGRAVWWKPGERGAPFERDTRYLEGEIHLSNNLQPSCSFKAFSIEYFVEMCNFNPDIFEHDSGSRSGILISQDIIIATIQGEGPTPIAYHERSKVEGHWNPAQQRKKMERANSLVDRAGFL